MSIQQFLLKYRAFIKHYSQKLMNADQFHDITGEIVHQMKILLMDTKKTLQEQIRNANLRNSIPKQISESAQEELDEKNGKIDELEEQLKEYQGHLNQQIDTLKHHNMDIEQQIQKTNEKVLQQEQTLRTMKVELLELGEFMSNIVWKSERSRKRNRFQDISSVKEEQNEMRPLLRDRVERQILERSHKEDIGNIQLNDNYQVKPPPAFAINPESKYIHKFNIQGGIIQFKEGRDGMFYQLLTNTPIKRKPVTSITLLQTAESWIYFGIVSEEYIHEQFAFWNKDLCIFYLAYNGDVFVGKKNTGNRRRKGALPGQTIVMTISDEKIVWSVGVKNLAQIIDPRIKNRQINWVPFIAMTQKGDKIQIE